MRRSQLLSLALLISASCGLFGCAASGITSVSGHKVTDNYEEFIAGKARLPCGVACSGRWGYNRAHFRRLYDQELWEDLAHRVTAIGFEADQTYYYLGRAAEGLGLNDAARTYYRLADATTFKCDGFINNCDGLDVPSLTRHSLARLNAVAAADNKTATPAIGPPTAAAGMAGIPHLPDIALEQVPQPTLASQPSTNTQPRSEPSKPLKATGATVQRPAAASVMQQVLRTLDRLDLATKRDISAQQYSTEVSAAKISVEGDIAGAGDLLDSLFLSRVNKALCLHSEAANGWNARIAGQAAHSVPAASCIRTCEGTVIRTQLNAERQGQPLTYTKVGYLLLADLWNCAHSATDAAHNAAENP